MISQKLTPRSFLLIFLFPFIYFSCSKDEISEDSKELTQQKLETPFSSYTILHKTSKFLDNKVDVLNSLKLIEKNIGDQKKAFNDSLTSTDFKIYTENITYVYSPEDFTESYSFFIEKDYKRNNYVIENLILRKVLNEKVYEAFIIKYFFKNGVNNPEKSMEVIGFEKININSLQGLTKSCINTYEYYVVETKHYCWRNIHLGADQEGECTYEEHENSAPPYSTWSVVVQINGCGGSGGLGTSDPTDPGSGDTSGPGGGPTGPGNGDGDVDTGLSLPPSCQTEECAKEDILANQINERLDNTLSYQELIWLYDNNIEATIIKNYIDNTSLYNPAFIKEAIGAWMAGGDVDFEEEIINNLSGIAKNIYTKLRSNSVLFENYIRQFDTEFPVSHLTFKINNTLRTGNYGRTLSPLNYNITIEMSNTQLANISELGGAVAFTHELVHAEIYRKMLSAARRGDLEPSNMTREQQIIYVNSLKDDFPGIYDYYRERYKPTWNHNMMASHYRGIIAEVVQKYDNSRLPPQVYEDIAWAGLRVLEDRSESIAWSSLSPSEQQRITANLTQYFFN